LLIPEFENTHIINVLDDLVRIYYNAHRQIKKRLFLDDTIDKWIEITKKIHEQAMQETSNNFEVVFI